MEDPAHLILTVLGGVILKPITLNVVFSFITMIILLTLSALVSGSEIAFFSLEATHIGELKEKAGKTDLLIVSLLDKPKRLLSTILISNNFINIGIVLTSTYFIDGIFDFSGSAKWITYLVNIGLVTFLLLLFGEIIPKIYATISPISFASLMAYPMFVLSKLSAPLSTSLIASTDFINNKLSGKKTLISVDDLSHVLDIAHDGSGEEREMLESIVRFGNIDVKSIMCPRVDVVAIEASSSYGELKAIIADSGYSRIPVYEGTFDRVKGIMYAKDLLTHLDHTNDYDWHKHIRDAYFVPESKKISDLLKDFQVKKMHIAIVIDEYGGTSGIVTLEDVIEEVMGDIQDESDELDLFYTKIDDRTYSFEGKTLIHDFCKILDLDDDTFEAINADTLAGLVLESTEEIPKKGEEFLIMGYKFVVQEADNRRIKRLKVEFATEN